MEKHSRFNKIRKNNDLLNIFLFKFFFNPRLYNVPKSLLFLRLGETTFTLDIHLRKSNIQLKRLPDAVLKRYPKIYKGRLKNKNSYKEFFLPLEVGNKSELIRFPLLFCTTETRDLMIQKLEENGIGAMG